MLADPQSLLGRLQRGRGDAVREVLCLPRDLAQQVLLQCLCTADDLTEQREGFVELVFALSPDLAPWFHWIEALGPDTPEEVRIYAFNTLGDLTQRGHGEAQQFLRNQVLWGCHWRDALEQYLVEGCELDLEAWSGLLPRLSDQDLDLHIYSKPDRPLWRELASADPRVERILRERLAKRAAYEQVTAWNEANYAHAASSQRRWKVVESLLRQTPEKAKPLLVDGLWDGSRVYREKCIARCHLEWPGVRARLLELARMGGSSPVAEAARRRLEELHEPEDPT